MKKKLLTTISFIGLLACSFTACKKEEVPEEEIVIESEDGTITEEAAPLEDTTALTCSLCEKTKVCAIYTANNKEYVVCADCANEYITAFSDIADKHVCGACEEEKICGRYVLKGTEYFVCLDDYNEFAHGMGLVTEDEVSVAEPIIPEELSDDQASTEEKPEEAKPSTEDTTKAEIPVCSLCEMEKKCGSYTINGHDYMVCDDCYEEFLYAFNLNEGSIARCSLCEVKKVCGEYIAAGGLYIVCPDCAEEFISAFEDSTEKNICSGCEREVVCGKYRLEGNEYYVCPEDFEEFAFGMGL